MGLDVGVYTTTWLPRPRDDAAYQFTWYLAENAAMGDNGNAFVIWDKEELRDLYRIYLLARKKDLIRADRIAIKSWIRGLPWDEDDLVSLHFNW